MQDFDGLQPFLFAYITAIRPFLFLVTARIRAVYVPFYVFRESHDYAVPAKTIYEAHRPQAGRATRALTRGGSGSHESGNPRRGGETNDERKGRQPKI